MIVTTDSILQGNNPVSRIYRNDREDFTIPNSAYAEGVRQIENGIAGREDWEYGYIDGVVVEGDNFLKRWIRKVNIEYGTW